MPSTGRWVRQFEGRNNRAAKSPGHAYAVSESKPGSASLTSFRAEIPLRLPLRGRGYGTSLGPVGVSCPSAPEPSEPSQMIGATADGYLLWA